LPRGELSQDEPMGDRKPTRKDKRPWLTIILGAILVLVIVVAALAYGFVQLVLSDMRAIP
jgi:hypothetical protein